VDRFITELGRSMASRTSRADLDWRFAVVNSPEVNAFALPGGFIYVNRGAIEQADRLDEIAGIMGTRSGTSFRDTPSNSSRVRSDGRLSSCSYVRSRESVTPLEADLGSA
jgi:hypothetical protein